MKRYTGFGIFFIFGLLVETPFAGAQSAQEKERAVRIIEYQHDAAQAHPRIPIEGILGDGKVEFVAHEFGFSGKTVQGAPYSAIAVTEFTQRLSDGNVISKKTSASVYRDSAGRTRREQMLQAGQSPNEQHQAIFINDPVSGVNYILDPGTRTARKHAVQIASGAAAGKAMVLDVKKATVVAGAATSSSAVLHVGPSDVAHVAIHDSAAFPVRKEPVGTQVINGVMAEGSRTLTTIPAGAIGNERPIEIVSEEWYSPDLQIVVFSHHADPRVGENTYELTQLTRTEQDPALFSIHADYKADEAGGDLMRMKKEE